MNQFDLKINLIVLYAISAGLTMVQMVHLSRGLWTRGTS